jgi:Ca-activated chloride channel family protein
VIGAALVWLLASASQKPPARPPLVFAAQVEVVRLDVTVHRGERSVLGLTAEDFEVRDNGVLQKVELVAADERRGDAVLVLDTSQSVAGEQLDQLKAATEAFVEGLAAEDAVSIIAFSDEARLLKAESDERESLNLAIEGLAPGGTTALFDAVYLGLKRTDTGRGRPVVLIFSDGSDRTSILTPDVVLDVARETDALIYALETGDDGWSIAHAAAEGGFDFLGLLTSQSGGRVWRGIGIADLRRSFLSVLDEIRSRYVLRFEPTGVAPGGWHKLKVRLKRGKGKVRARRGYRRNLR